MASASTMPPATNEVPNIGATLHSALTPPSSMPASTLGIDSNTEQLKYLQPVVNAAGSAAALAESTYTTTKGYLPGVAVKHLQKVEELAGAYAAPVASKVQDQGLGLLNYADLKVEAAVITTNNLINSGKQGLAAGVNGTKELADSNVRTFKAAADKYFDLVTSTADWAASKLSVTNNVTAARELLATSIAKAKEMSDPDVAVDSVYEAWESFASIPAVHAVLDAAEPVTKRGLSSFYSLHDYLVASPYYSAGVHTGASAAQVVSNTLPYKLTKKYAYPLVAPLADPLLDKLNGSTYVQQLLAFWAPASAASTGDAGSAPGVPHNLPVPPAQQHAGNQLA